MASSRPTDIARAALNRVSPRHRRWQQLLAGLTLDPDALAQPLEAPTSQDVVICGSPRSGTALATAFLYQPTGAVSVMEPWDGMRLPPAELFRSLRTEIRDTGRVTRSRLDVEALLGERAVRWCREGSPQPSVALAEDGVLAIKWPAFWRYLELLPDTKFIVCVRDPVEVISSYEQTGGRLALGYDYDIAFNRTMNDALAVATDDVAVRRVLLHDYIAERIVPHLDRDEVYVLRYERWFTEPEQVVDELGAFLDLELRADVVEVRRPPRASTEAAARALVLEHCRTLEALGYDSPR